LALLPLFAPLITARVIRSHASTGLLLLGLAALLSFSLRAYASAAFQGRRRMMPALIVELVYMAGVTLYFALMGPRLTVVKVFAGLFTWGCGRGGPHPGREADAGPG
jgi:hypothetical protein